MKIMVLILGILSTTAKAEASLEGCQLGNLVLPFANFKQEGAARVAKIQLTANAYAKYVNVSNLDSLSLVVNGQEVAFSSAIMGPVQIEAVLNGTPLLCQMSQ